MPDGIIWINAQYVINCLLDKAEPKGRELLVRALKYLNYPGCFWASRRDWAAKESECQTK